MTAPKGLFKILSANYTVPFFIITIITGLAYPAISSKVKDESNDRIIAVDKLSTTLARLAEKHEQDITELRKDNNDKYDRIICEISEVKRSVGRLEGKVLQ